MQTTASESRLNDLLQHDLGVKESYRHTAKWASPGASMQTSGAFLKWYRLAPQDEPVPEAIDRLARNYLGKTNLEAKGLGFVILHRCGNGFYFLIVNTWRGNNEVWETVFYKDGEAMRDFAPFPRDGAHKPSFCVWELAAVWHEKEAWERFLLSDRGIQAANAWQSDLYTGVA
jgi:hypothetical protein